MTTLIMVSLNCHIYMVHFRRRQQNEILLLGGNNGWLGGILGGIPNSSYCDIGINHYCK